MRGKYCRLDHSRGHGQRGRRVPLRRPTKSGGRWKSDPTARGRAAARWHQIPADGPSEDKNGDERECRDDSSGCWTLPNSLSDQTSRCLRLPTFPSRITTDSRFSGIRTGLPAVGSYGGRDTVACGR
jgi:hypothetical protein